MSSRPIPAPAIIDGEEWQVRDSGEARKAFVDFSTKTMVVPLDAGPVGDLLRNHETAHVAITPRDAGLFKRLAKEFPNRTLQAAEDARVYIALQRAGIDTDVSHWPKADIDKIAALPDTPEANEEKARCLLAVKGTADYAKLSKVLPKEIVSQVESLYDKHFGEYVRRGELPPFEATVEIARELHATIDPTPPSGDGEDEEEDKGSGGKGSSGGERKSGDKEVSRPFVPGDIVNMQPAPRITKNDLTEAEKQMLSEVVGHGMRGYIGDGGTPIPDENVQILQPKLMRRQKGKGLGNKRVCTDNGSIPRRLSRYAVDSAVFSRTIKGGYATVLVDVSGSMGFSSEDVDEIIDALPHCTVATYSGSGVTGNIVIVARDGRRIESFPREMFRGGNVVDLQAVKWLAKQRGPRYWICDGIVTGEGDQGLGVLPSLMLSRVAVLANIKRFASLSDLMKRISQKTATAYHG